MNNKQIPDIATKFSYIFDWDNKPSTFRVSAWLKAVPLRYKTFNDPAESDENNKMMNEIFQEFFLKDHPDWHHDYVLMHCIREEATHVHGVGVAGCTVALNDPKANFSHEYVGWNKETIDDERKRTIHMIKFYNENADRQIIKGEWHD